MANLSVALIQLITLRPLFTELRSIVIKTFGLADVIKQALKPLSTQIQITFIYGSIAKPEDNAASDIDLMLISKELSYADLFPLLQKIEPQLGRTINPTFYTPTELTRKTKTFLFLYETSTL